MQRNIWGIYFWNRLSSTAQLRIPIATKIKLQLCYITSFLFNLFSLISSLLLNNGNQSSFRNNRLNWHMIKWRDQRDDLSKQMPALTFTSWTQLLQKAWIYLTVIARQVSVIIPLRKTTDYDTGLNKHACRDVSVEDFGKICRETMNTQNIILNISRITDQSCAY